MAPDGRIVDINQGYCHMTGFTRGQIIDSHLSKFEIEDSLKITNDRLNQIKLVGHGRFETRHQHRDGQTLYIEASVSYVPDTGHFIYFLRNITNNKITENELKISAIAFEAQESMMVSDNKQIVLRVNHAFSEITGYEPAEMIGKTALILRSAKHDESFYNALWDKVINEGAWAGEIYCKRKNGNDYPAFLNVTAVNNDAGEITNFVSTLTDITLSKKANQEIQRLAFYDQLTDLPNRRLFLERLNHALTRNARSGKHGALFFLDLDNFKALNDTHGHDYGDLLLQEVGNRLKKCLRESDTVARLGGDEYVVLIEDLDSKDSNIEEQIKATGNKILSVLSRPYLLKNLNYSITSSVGVTLLSGQETEVEELLKQADVAMYQAKKAGRNTLRFFNPQMQENIAHLAALEIELRTALELQQFQLHYQIQVDDAGDAIGAEALIRWAHPQRGLLPPIQFISLAEDSSLILPIGDWVLETACSQIKAWQQNKLTSELVLSINISAKQFHQEYFVEQVQAAVLDSGINPALLKLELTESMLLNDADSTIEAMGALKEIGVQFSLDDFGTGFSSLQLLQALPLNQLKIDRSFVHNITADSNDLAIVQTIVVMAETLNLNVIAEGVETKAQQTLLLKSGCKQFQGYLFGKPLPIKEFEKKLKQKR